MKASQFLEPQIYHGYQTLPSGGGKYVFVTGVFVCSLMMEHFILFFLFIITFSYKCCRKHMSPFFIIHELNSSALECFVGPYNNNLYRSGLEKSQTLGRNCDYKLRLGFCPAIHCWLLPTWGTQQRTVPDPTGNRERAPQHTLSLPLTFQSCAP